MARFSNTFIGQQAYGQTSLTPMIDVTNGGQFGLLTDFPHYISSTPYVRRNIVCRVIDLPRGFDFLPNPEKFRAAVKAMFELHPKAIDLGNTKLTVESVDTPVGGSGEKLETPSNVTRGVVEPNFTLVERQGRPFTAILETWVTFLIMDPITKIPRLVTLAQNKGKIIDLLPDFIGATMLFFEPDPTFTKVEKAWLSTNMYPKETPDEEGKFDKTTAGDLLEFQLPMTALTQVGYGVKLLAQQLLNEINLTGANPNTRPAFIDAISPDVLAANGFAEQLASAASTAIKI